MMENAKGYDFAGKNILIVGMARSGIAAAKMLHRLGARLTLNDARSREEIGGTLDELEALDGRLDWRLGEQPDGLAGGRDMIVFSSGVPFWSDWIIRARGAGIPCFNELEIGYMATKAPIAAITGTNGKTTTTTLLCEMARAAGKQSYALGNIGLPVCAHALELGENDLIAAEVAPFQMVSTRSFRPRASAILNITEDHLDWFKTMQNYIAGKALVFKNQTEDDYCILNYDDPITRQLMDRPKAQVLLFSHEIVPEKGIYLQGGNIYVKLGNEAELICGAEEVKLPGEHNLENAMAAALSAYCMGVPAGSIAAVLRSFEGVEHRIETVRTVQGVTFINDSKGTNPVAAEKAINSMRADTVLILGGSEKNSDFLPLLEGMPGQIKHIVVLGDTAGRIMQAAQQAGYTAIERAESFEDGVRIAYERAESGMNVLLSPACASYDMFKNFEERGAEFKRLVWGLE